MVEEEVVAVEDDVCGSVLPPLLLLRLPPAAPAGAAVAAAVAGFTSAPAAAGPASPDVDAVTSPTTPSSSAPPAAAAVAAAAGSSPSSAAAPFCSLAPSPWSSQWCRELSPSDAEVGVVGSEPPASRQTRSVTCMTSAPVMIGGRVERMRERLRVSRGGSWSCWSLCWSCCSSPSTGVSVLFIVELASCLKNREKLQLKLKT